MTSYHKNISQNEVEEMMRALNQSFIISKTDVKGDINYVNHLFCQISGYREEELLGNNHRIIKSSFHDDVFYKNLWETISSGCSWRGKINNRKKDGSTYWMDTVIIPYHDKLGIVSGYLSLRFDLNLEHESWEEKYRYLFEQSNDSVMTLEPPDWIFTNANNATIQLFGAKNKKEFLSLRPWDLSPEYQSDGELSSEKAPKMIQIALKRGSHHFYWDHKKLDETIIPCTVLLSRTEIAGKEFLQATVRDITEQKKANDNLVKITQELDNFFNLTLNYLCIAHIDGYLKKVNKSWMKLGYSKDYLLSTPFLDFVHPDDVDQTIKEVQKLSSGIPTLRFENRYRRIDGEYIHLEWITTPDLNTGLLYCVATDVTDRKRQEKINTILSELRLAYIHNISKIVNFYLFFCQAVRDFLGCEESYLYSKTHEAEKVSSRLISSYGPGYTESLPLDEVGHLNLFFKDNYAHIPIILDSSSCYLLILSRKDRGIFQDQIENINPILDVFSDLMRSYNYFLELEKQKNIALHQAKLASIGQMAAGIGHEINNPLAIVQGQLEMLADYLDENKMKDVFTTDKISKISKSINRISQITKGMVSFSRTDQMTFEQCSLDNILIETIDLVRDLYRKDQVEIYLTIENGEHQVMGNRGRLQQVLFNLLKNAKDAVQNTVIKEIYVHCKTTTSHQIIVEDSGIGIGDLNEPLIFDPFYTTKKINEGSGLGLSIVYAIMKDHHGLIEVKSSKYGGAKFVLSFPKS